jgi:Family of unknown function (DUF6516)
VNARDYYLGVQRTVHDSALVLNSDLLFEEVDEHACYVKGILLLISDFQLYIAEYVLTSPVVTRPKYRYHLQTLSGQLISRWDNATHHHEVSTFPDHRHDDRDGIHPSPPMDLSGVLDAVLAYILPLQSD